MVKDASAGSTSLVSRPVVIEGEISGDENLHVDGRVKGIIRLTETFSWGQRCSRSRDRRPQYRHSRHGYRQGACPPPIRSAGIRTIQWRVYGGLL